MRTCFVLVILISLNLLLLGCIGSGKAPLETLNYTSEPAKNHNLIVFLQGLGGTTNCFISGHACFESQGFVEAVRSRGLPYDMAAPNTHFGYYNSRTLEERLRADVILPAKASGYKKIWLVGVSMGGLGSALYFKQHTPDIAGVLILGPFLGDSKILDEIIAAGGVAQWDPGDYDAQEDWQRMLWHWLKDYNRRQGNHAPIYLGYGTDDPYVKGHALLASYLPPAHVIAVDGGHSFSTFKDIWEIFLDRGILQ